MWGSSPCILWRLCDFRSQQWQSSYLLLALLKLSAWLRLDAQGCQMANFQPKTPDLGTFWMVLHLKMSVYILCGHLVYFTVIRYILWPFGILYDSLIFPVLVCCTKKNLATLVWHRNKSFPVRLVLTSTIVYTSTSFESVSLGIGAGWPEKFCEKVAPSQNVAQPIFLSNQYAFYSLENCTWTKIVSYFCKKNRPK
jgi:hypothetical protein